MALTGTGNVTGTVTGTGIGTAIGTANWTEALIRTDTRTKTIYKGKPWIVQNKNCVTLHH